MRLPDISRPGVHGIVLRTWRTDDQVRAANAALATWRSRAWPDDLVSRSVLLGADGRLVLHYEQWSSPQLGYRLVESGPPADEPAGVVIVSFGVSKAAQQRRLLDLIRPRLTPGSHLHGSTDGFGVLVWAERDDWGHLDELPWVERLSSQRFRPHEVLVRSSAATLRSA